MKLIMRVGILMCLLALAVWGQAPTGEITGTVTDASGAAVPGATLTLTHPATNTQREVSSNEAGVYSLPALPPGLYELKVSKEGFASQVRGGIELLVGQI